MVNVTETRAIHYHADNPKTKATHYHNSGGTIKVILYRVNSLQNRKGIRCQQDHKGIRCQQDHKGIPYLEVIRQQRRIPTQISTTKVRRTSIIPRIIRQSSRFYSHPTQTIRSLRRQSLMQIRGRLADMELMHRRPTTYSLTMELVMIWTIMSTAACRPARMIMVQMARRRQLQIRVQDCVWTFLLKYLLLCL